jgi:cellobiose-specific phosphotransferase system component IIA
MGTILSLKGLLVDSGKTLQDIQPELGGAFVGTLAGILGSLVATFGGLILDRSARGAIQRVEDYVRTQILPLLPEQRIAVRIEEAVLERIAEKAQFAVDRFRIALEPLSTSLAESATKSAEAAAEATSAFTQAVRAVREAGNLESASKSLRNAASSLDSAGEFSKRAAQLSGENLLRLEAIHQSIGALAHDFTTASDTLSESGKTLADAHRASIEILSDKLSGIASATEALGTITASAASELARRSDLDTTYVKTIDLQARAAGELLEALRDTARGSEVALASIADRLGNLGDVMSEGVRREIRDRIGSLADRLSQALGDAIPALDGAVHSLTETVKLLRSEQAEIRSGAPQYANAMAAVSTESRRLTQELVGVAGQVSKLHRLLAEGTRDGETVAVGITQPESPELTQSVVSQKSRSSRAPKGDEDHRKRPWWSFKPKDRD